MARPTDQTIVTGVVAASAAPARCWSMAGPPSAKLLKSGTLKTCKGFSHRVPTTEAASLNVDLWVSIKD